MIRLSPGPRVEDSDVEAFERRLGQALPDGYRNFLLTTNGGEPEPNFIPHPDGNVGSLRWFLSLRRGDEYDIEANLTHGVPLPSGLLAIAEDDFGNPYCLDLLEGGVYYWDRELEGYEQDINHPSMNPALLLAPTFEEFMLRLTPESRLN